MNQKRGNGMISSLITIGATGMAIYGISRGLRNGKLKTIMNSLGKMMAGQSVQQMAVKPIQEMVKPIMQGKSMGMQAQSTSGNTGSNLM